MFVADSSSMTWARLSRGVYDCFYGCWIRSKTSRPISNCESRRLAFFSKGYLDFFILNIIEVIVGVQSEDLWRL
jgi:hypothetical protein